MTAELGKIKLRTTPRRVALEFIDWLQKGAGEACPLAASLARMKKEIESLMDHGRASSVYGNAVKQVRWLIELYAAGMSPLLDTMCECFQLLSFAQPYIGLWPVPSPTLLKLLVDARNRLFVRAAIAELVPVRHFRTTVVPQPIWDIYLSLHRALLLECLRISGTRFEGIGLIDEETCFEEAQSELAGLESSARRVAGVVQPGWTAWFIRNRVLNMMASCQRWISKTELLIADWRRELDRKEHANQEQRRSSPKRKSKPRKGSRQTSRR